MLKSKQDKNYAFLVRPSLGMIDFLPAPFPLSVLAFFIGCLGYFYAPSELSSLLIWGLALINALGLMLLWQQQHFLGIKCCLIGLGLTCGAGYSQITTQLLWSQSMQLVQSAQQWSVRGIVTDKEIMSDARVRLRLEEVTLNQTALRGAIRISAALAPEKVNVGNRLYTRAVLFTPSPPMVPGGFDFQRWAFFQGIVASGYSVMTPILDTPEMVNSNVWDDLRARVQQAITRDFAPQQSALVRTLLLGDRAGLSEQQWQQFRLAGLSHLLAISGMHIGMVALSVFAFIRAAAALVPRLVLFYPIHRYAALIAVLMAAGYVGLAGGSVSATRAFLMLSLFMLGIVWETQTLRFHSLACAALLIMLYAPHTVTSPGFQLSFAAVWVMVAYYTRPRNIRTKRFYSPIFGGKVLRMIGDIALCTLLITVVTAPILWWHFQVLYPWGVVGNLLALPLMSVLVMPLIFIYFLSILSGLSGLVAPWLSLVLDGLMAWAQLVGRLPYAAWNLPTIPLVSVGLFSLISHVLILHWRRLEISHYVTLACAFAVGVLWLQHNPQARAIVLHAEKTLVIADQQSWMFLGQDISQFHQQQFQQYWRIPQQPAPTTTTFDFAGWQCSRHDKARPISCLLSTGDAEIWFKNNVLSCGKVREESSENICAMLAQAISSNVPSCATFFGFTQQKIWLNSSCTGRPWQQLPFFAITF